MRLAPSDGGVEILVQISEILLEVLILMQTHVRLQPAPE